MRGNLPAVFTGDVRFPGEDGGQSLGAMAQRDLDAALQLLADRAQYITGSSGAAIALRRSDKNDMLCRASSGANAPELGALLSTEFGLSGESVRTRQLLRCDDAERDARVNREACRELGIASVAVMPVVNDDEVLGVFELFSGRSHAFGERDFAALRRLSEMVETAVRLARAAEVFPSKLNADPRVASVQTLEDPDTILEVDTETVGPALAATPLAKGTQVDMGELATAPAVPPVLPAPFLSTPSPLPESQPAVLQEASFTTEVPAANPIPATPADPAPADPALGSTKPLLWSIALDAREESDTESDQSGVPAAFRNLRKCEACGFPVSAGRTYCVECEEKKWRGQLKAGPRRPDSATALSNRALIAPLVQRVASSGQAAAAAPAKSPEVRREEVTPSPSKAPQVQGMVPKSPLIPVAAETAPVKAASEALASLKSTETSPPELILSAGLEPSQSWFSANKFIIIPILLIAAIAVVFMVIR